MRINEVSDLLKSLMIQMEKEYKNSFIYLKISSFLSTKGMNKLSKKFYEQYKEELSHAEQIFEFLDSMNVEIEVPQVSSMKINFTSPLELAMFYFNLEKETTDSLTEIYNLAREEDSLSEMFLKKMIEQQIHETDETYRLLDLVELSENKWYNLELIYSD
ncbi:MAG: hypothetical protein KatS3mg002_1062 [Candidatus Woesearchaeota archaeon]|jgi:ferritin|nr:MAG: hypothetical protein KatS3mg002_1062 [Candidatus Woesearchaeota archaeon]